MRYLIRLTKIKYLIKVSIMRNFIKPTYKKYEPQDFGHMIYWIHSFNQSNKQGKISHKTFNREIFSN